MFNRKLKEEISQLKIGIKTGYENIREIREDKLLLEKELLQQSVDNAPHVVKTEIEGNVLVHAVYIRKLEAFKIGELGVVYRHINTINEYRSGAFDTLDLAKQAIAHLTKEDILL